ncbi:MAG TPA: glycosyltransferase family 2 protein [Flavitalea sp.]|nr:glycosyltransferase family 2 protein [Flavitalea sp.]
MIIAEILFWLALLFILYVYGGYVLFTLPFKRKQVNADRYLRPKCTLLIAAYNEETIIAEKIRNSLELEYPQNLLEIVVVADGSTDKTSEIVSAYPSVRLFYQPERKGKLAAIQRVLPTLKSEIVVFTDANALLNKTALANMVPHFSDPKVGAVSGEKKVRSLPATTGTEGIYWKYESWLKKKDARFYSIAGAAGELLAVRSSLYTVLEENLVLDDFIQSMLICNQGYRVEYEPSAFASELPSPTLQFEFVRKMRIAAGGFQAVNYLKNKMDLKKYPRINFLYYSHRVFRWTAAPFCFFALLPLNVWMALVHPGFFYKTILVIQACIYLIAILGIKFSKLGKSPVFIPVVHYFFMMQIAAISGFVQYKRNEQTAIWEKIPRI